MFDTLRNGQPASEPTLTASLAAAASAIARLDEALVSHPLRPAFLYRARLDAVRRQAAVDGQLIDSWHLAAVLEGFRLRMDGRLGFIGRGAVLDAARHAFDQYQWLVMPDFDQEGAVQQAERHLAGFGAHGDAPLLAAARGVHAWLDDGRTGGTSNGDPAHGSRPPIRAALVRFWMRHSVLRTPVPLTGAAALRAETPFDLAAWLPAFLYTLAAEAADGRQLLMDLERAWFAARAAVAGRRRDSHAAAAVDVLAAVPLISATSLAAALGLAIKNAIRLLDGLVAAGVAVEVTHRAKRRLFGLKDMAPLAEAVRPPYRPTPGRGRGRPPLLTVEEEVVGPPPPLPPLTPIERRAFDCSELEAAMAFADEAVRNARRNLGALATRPSPSISDSCPGETVLSDADESDEVVEIDITAPGDDLAP
jgi:hypothetical protein